MEFDDDLDEIELSSTNVNVESVKGIIHDLIGALGEDAEREGLKNTPLRVARMYTELFAGYTIDPQKVVNGALFNISYDEMVLVRDIEFYSFVNITCCHFWGAPMSLTSLRVR
jgi:GTP cyclohydrolase I